MTIDEVEILHNSADKWGGGMITRGGHCYLNASTLKYNSAPYGSAIEVGGVYHEFQIVTTYHSNHIEVSKFCGYFEIACAEEDP